MNKLKKKMMEGEDTLQTMKKGMVYKYGTPTKKFNNSAKDIAIRVAADEKDKVHASAKGKKALDHDISSMVSHATKKGCVLSKHSKSN